MMAMQTTSSLRALVVRRVGLGRRVAVLSGDLALRQLLEANRCAVLVDPDDEAALTGFAPEVVVAFDGLANDEGAGFLRVAETAPSAELVFSFASSASAGGVLRALVGQTATPRLAEADVRRWLRLAGYAVQTRDAVVEPPSPSGLSADTEVALRQLLEQLNPDAVADRFVLTARRGVATTTPVDVEAGLLSVVVSAGDERAAVEATLASLVNQPQRPLEILVASPLSAEVLDAVLAPAKRRAGVVAVGVPAPSSDWATRTNAGLAAAQGQYVACLEAGDTVTADHFPTLVRRLAGGPEAWALAATLPELPTRFSTAAWLHRGASWRQAVLVDRQRTATLPLTFAEGTPGAEAMRFARLAALFAPAWHLSAPSVSRTQPASNETEPLLAATQGRPLRMLTTLADVLRAPEPPSLRKVATERAATWLETIRRRGREGQ